MSDKSFVIKIEELPQLDRAVFYVLMIPFGFTAFACMIALLCAAVACMTPFLCWMAVRRFVFGVRYA